SVDGTYTVVYTDQAGNTTEEVIKLDTVSPVISKDKTANAQGWYKEAVTLTGEAGVGVTVNGSSVTLPHVISVDGTYTVVYTDQAGNTTEEVIKLDTVSPVISKDKTANAQGWYKEAVTLTGEAGVGVTVNGSSDTSPYVISVDGTYTVVYTDQAGN